MTSRVEFFHDGAFEHARKQIKRGGAGFMSSDAGWFELGKKTARDVWPDLTLTGTQCEHLRPNDLDLDSNFGRTVRVSYAVSNPKPFVGGTAVAIFDQDDGHLMYLTYAGPKPTNSGQ